MGKQHDYENFIEDESQFSLESILAEYRVSSVQEQQPSNGEVKSESRSRAIVMQALSQTVEAAKVSSDDTGPERGPEPRAGISESEPERKRKFELLFINGNQPESGASSDSANTGAGRGKNVPRQNAGGQPVTARPVVEEAVRVDDSGEYAASDFGQPEPEPESEPASRRLYRDAGKRGAAEAIMAPIVGLLALVAIGRHSKKPRPESPQKQAGPQREERELPPGKAAKLYASQIRSLKIREMIAGALCFVLAYISYAYYNSLPLSGMLGASTAVAALTCLIFELAVIMTGLDVFTAGITSLLAGEPAAESLVAVSCIVSVLDAVAVAGGSVERGLPYCAVSALSMVFAIRGARKTCVGMWASFKTASASKTPYALTAETGVDEGGTALIKSHIPINGFVHASEQPDVAERAYRAAAPLLMAASVIMAIVCAIKLGSAPSFLHSLSAMTAASASFTALISFPELFASTARRLRRGGTAVAGYAGCAEIGKSKRVVITDTDIFPPGTVSISGIRILEGTFTEKVVSYTGSLLAASGSGLSAVFTEMMSKKGYTMLRIEDYEYHEGGGITAVIKDEKVYVGSSGFMNLMGVRLPQNLTSKTAVFTAINDKLVGIFSVEYTPVASVQDALVSLLEKRSLPVFAVRDFNITPQMIRQKFKLPTESFDFPSFAERCRISAIEPAQDKRAAAVLSRPGLDPMVETVRRGRQLYRFSGICTGISVAGSITGLILMFWLCVTGAFDSATAANMTTFMLLWLAPMIIVSFGISR